MLIKIQKLDTANNNGRIYSTEEIKKALANLPEDKSVLGTIGYPQDRGRYIQDFTGLPIDEISHQVKNLRVEDGFLVGNLEVLETPKGQQLQGMFDGDIELAFRPNGYGNVVDGVVTDYTLVGIAAIPTEDAA